MSDRSLQQATLGGGCFWCLEAVYQRVEGVEVVASGYSGGHVDDPDYRSVCSGSTGHAEVVQVTFDPAIVSYRRILEIFFTIHDPTQLNRQGADVGTQYRSVIFTHSDEQRAVAEKLIAELEDEAVWDEPIVTAIEPLETFWQAEDYHQDYYRQNPRQPYCQVVVEPKLQKFETRFEQLVRRS